jgi:hypothetical protein
LVAHFSEPGPQRFQDYLVFVVGKTDRHSWNPFGTKKKIITGSEETARFQPAANKNKKASIQRLGEKTSCHRVPDIGKRN